MKNTLTGTILNSIIFFFMETIELILKTLDHSEQPLKAGEIAEAAGLKKKEVDKAMKVLKEEGRIVSPKRCFWTTA